MKSKILKPLEKELDLLAEVIADCESKTEHVHLEVVRVLHCRFAMAIEKLDRELNLISQQISDIHGIAHTIENELIVTHDEPMRLTAKETLERFTSPCEILKDIPWEDVSPEDIKKVDKNTNTLIDFAKKLCDGPPDLPSDETVIRDDFYKKMHAYYDGSDRQLKDEE